MGSFTEANFAITLAGDTPPELLSAFAAFRRGDDGAPELDQPIDANAFDADSYLGNWSAANRVPPPVDTLPVAQQAALLHHLTWYSENAYWAGTPATMLRWERWSGGEGCWTLTMRALPKLPAEDVQAIVAPLGRWAIEGAEGRRRFVGYIDDEEPTEPLLIWAEGRRPFTFTGGLANG